MTTLAGTPFLPPFQFDNVDGVGSSARFYWPSGIWGDGTFLYVTDQSFHSVRRIRIANGETITVAGMTGKAGSDDVRGLAARFRSPSGIWSDGVDIYAVDQFNQAIRRLTLSRTGNEPQLTSIAPPATSPGTIVTFTITGSNFIPLDTAVVVNGPGTRVAGINVKSSTTIDVAVEIAPNARIGARTVRVLQSSGTSNPISFEIGTAPDNTNTAFAIGSRGAFSAISAEQFGAASVGYARLESVPGTQPPAGFAIYGYRAGGVLVSEAAVPAAGLVQTGRISFDSTGAANTGVAILNPNGVPVRLSYTMNRPDGSQFFQGSTDLAPGQQLSRFLNEFPYWGGSPDIQETFSFTASSPVSVRRFVCTWRRTTRFELVLRLRIRERQSRRSPMN